MRPDAHAPQQVEHGLRLTSQTAPVGPGQMQPGHELKTPRRMGGLLYQGGFVVAHGATIRALARARPTRSLRIGGASPGSVRDQQAAGQVL